MRSEFTARDVPGLRRDVTAFANSDLSRIVYLNAIHQGKQVFRPGHPTPEADAGDLAYKEHHRLANADLYFLDADLCELTTQAEPDMPAWTPTPDDLPSQYGFVCLGQPMRPKADNAFTHAIAWGPMTWRDASHDNRKSPAVMMSIYCIPEFWQEPHLSDPTLRHLRTAQPRLAVDNEAIVPLTMPDDPVTVPHDATTLSWYARWLYCAFRIASQGDLTEDAHQQAERAERKRHIRAGITANPDVRITRLKTRTTAAGTGEGSGRDYQHRWVVRGHWRQQWYPSKDAHRPKYIAPYMKGPDDAPMIGGEKVTIAMPPSRTVKTNDS